MKKPIAFLLFLTGTYVATAQYVINCTQQGGTPPTYRCSITPGLGESPFEHQDLITWFFPDGQFRQQMLEVDQSSQILNSSNEFIWTPVTDAPSGPNDVVAYVAKKGGPGIPPKRAASGSPVTGSFSGSPAPFAMPPTANWQINRTWEFAPGFENFLIVSYRLNPVCDIHPVSEIFLEYSTSELFMQNTDNLFYQNEKIVNISPDKIKISNLAYNDKINHVFINLETLGAVPVGKQMNVTVTGSMCGSGIDTILFFRAKGDPHDPNEKLANRDVLCELKPNRADLEYYIRFQNDGNAPVDKVLVEDYLPAELDPQTLSLDDVPNFSQVYDGAGVTGNKFHIQFKDLQLPGLKQTNPHYAYDQTTYGFTFDICTQSSLPTAIITNRADIYFYNSSGSILPVVYTNDDYIIVTDTNCYEAPVSCVVPVAEKDGIISSVDIAPNPFQDQTHIFITLKEKTRLRIMVSDISGRLIEPIADTEYGPGNHQLTPAFGKAPPGLYLLHLYTGRDRITRKIIRM